MPEILLDCLPEILPELFLRVPEIIVSFTRNNSYPLKLCILLYKSEFLPQHRFQTNFGQDFGPDFGRGDVVDVARMVENGAEEEEEEEEDEESVFKAEAVRRRRV